MNFENVAVVLKYIWMIATKYDKTEALAESQINLLQERRTALISAAVTGKIDVRNWQPPTTPQNSPENP